MTLRSRLEAARGNYLALPSPDVDVAPTGTPPAGRRPYNSRRRLAFAVAATLAILAGGAAAIWRDGTGRSSDVIAGPDHRVPKSNDTDPPGAIAPFSNQIRLVPAGPYADGQEIALSVPAGFAQDLINGGVRQCAVLADAPAGPGEWCDPTDHDSGSLPSATTIEVRATRFVFTPTGERDCEDPEVTCRLVVRSASGDVASRVLRFSGDGPTHLGSVDIQATGTAGEVTIRAAGLEPHRSWLDLRKKDPARAASYGAFWVSVCAFGIPDEPEDPWGSNQWIKAPGRTDVPTANCDSYHAIANIDPDNAEAATRAHVPTWFLGYGGWSDCRRDTCFLQIQRTIVSGLTQDGALIGRDEVAALGLLQPKLLDPAGTRPSLRVITPGPHVAGQTLTVEVSGLPGAIMTDIGVCQSDHPWTCGYIGASMGKIGNGLHTIQLPNSFTCADRCYLELDSQGEGMPPLATAALTKSG